LSNGAKRLEARTAEVAVELVKRQAADGSWANPVELVRENDPLVATSQAVIALSAGAVTVK